MTDVTDDRLLNLNEAFFCSRQFDLNLTREVSEKVLLENSDFKYRLRAQKRYKTAFLKETTTKDK